MGDGLKPEDASAVAASYIFCLTLALLMCVILPVEFLLDSTGSIPLLAGLLALCIISCFFISITNKTTISTILIATYAYGMCAWFLWTGLVNDNSILYYFWVIPMVIVCLNARLGAILSVIFIVIITILFLPPVHVHMANPLDPGFRFRFLLAFICMFMVAGMAEYYLHLMFKSIFAINQELEQYSLTDTLTGQGNRRNFINQFQRLHALQLRSGDPFTLVMIDIDHFKRVNDSHGHLLGDEVLIFIAETMALSLRQQDSLYRWGGEEFIALLPGTDLDQGRIAAERMRKAIEERPFTKGSIEIALTVSLGVYTVSTAQPMHEHIKNTDTLLYQAKAAGRNRVVAADEGSGMVIAVPLG